MDADVVQIYERLRFRYPLTLTASRSLGYQSSIDFPVLSGNSCIGRVEMFYDDISYAFYAMNGNREVFEHWHCQSVAEAEQYLIDFMEGNLTLVQFGLQT